MYSSFILSKSGIMGYQVSDLVGENRPLALEMKHKPGDRSAGRDDSFFHTGDPNQDKITAMDVIRRIPHGRFHHIMVCVYFILFISTSTLSYNFAFLLMPQSYLCPIIEATPIVLREQDIGGAN